MEGGLERADEIDAPAHRARIIGAAHALGPGKSLARILGQLAPCQRVGKERPAERGVTIDEVEHPPGFVHPLRVERHGIIDKVGTERAEAKRSFLDRGDHGGIDLTRNALILPPSEPQSRDAIIEPGKIVGRFIQPAQGVVDERLRQ